MDSRAALVAALPGSLKSPMVHEPVQENCGDWVGQRSSAPTLPLLQDANGRSKDPWKDLFSSRLFARRPTADLHIQRQSRCVAPSAGRTASRSQFQYRSFLDSAANAGTEPFLLNLCGAANVCRWENISQLRAVTASIALATSRQMHQRYCFAMQCAVGPESIHRTTAAHSKNEQVAHPRVHAKPARHSSRYLGRQ